jgi:hypothetical protein
MALGEHAIDAFLKRGGGRDGEVFPQHGNETHLIVVEALEVGDDLLGLVALLGNVAGAADKDAEGGHGGG